MGPLPGQALALSSPLAEAQGQTMGASGSSVPLWEACRYICWAPMAPSNPPCVPSWLLSVLPFGKMGSIGTKNGQAFLCLAQDDRPRPRAGRRVPGMDVLWFPAGWCRLSSILLSGAWGFISLCGKQIVESIFPGAPCVTAHWVAPGTSQRAPSSPIY